MPNGSAQHIPHKSRAVLHTLYNPDYENASIFTQLVKILLNWSYAMFFISILSNKNGSTMQSRSGT